MCNVMCVGFLALVALDLGWPVARTMYVRQLPPRASRDRWRRPALPRGRDPLETPRGGGYESMRRIREATAVRDGRATTGRPIDVKGANAHNMRTLALCCRDT